MKMKEEKENTGLKLNIQKTKIMASWQIDGETVETVSDFISLGSKITADGDCSHEIKRRLLLHAKMGSIKDRNGMDLTEAEDIKKSWREYTEELYKKDLHDPDNHDGMNSPRARHPGVWSQVGLRKHHYEQS